MLLITVVPVIHVHPVTQAGIAGGSVTLNCTARGFPLTDIVWLKNGIQLNPDLIDDTSVTATEGDEISILITSSITIENLQLHDVANYSCNASNDLFEPRWAVSDEAELTVLCKYYCSCILYVLHWCVLFIRPS